MVKRPCRQVDREYAECPRCSKTLTLRVLAYNHAKVCKAYDDRVIKRTTEAREKYLHDFSRMYQKGDSDTIEETRDIGDSQMELLDTESEKTDGETSQGTPQVHNSENGENLFERTFEGTRERLVGEKNVSSTN